MSRRIDDWEIDTVFVAIAQVAWEDDFLESITDHPHKYGTHYNRHIEARKRMRARYEGFKFAESVKERVDEVEEAARAILERVAEIRKGMKE